MFESEGDGTSLPARQHSFPVRYLFLWAVTVLFLQLSSEGLRFPSYGVGEWCHSICALKEGVQRFKIGWEAKGYFTSSGKETSLKELRSALSILKQTDQAGSVRHWESLPSGASLARPGDVSRKGLFSFTFIAFKWSGRKTSWPEKKKICLERKYSLF